MRQLVTLVLITAGILLLSACQQGDTQQENDRLDSELAESKTKLEAALEQVRDLQGQSEGFIMDKRTKSIVGKEIQKLVKFAKALDKMNEEWLQELGNEVLVEAQNLAPVGSGHLKESHKVEYTEDGFKIIADTPYAYALHEGKKQEGQKRGIHKSKVKAHDRKYKPTSVYRLISKLADAPTRRSLEAAGAVVTALTVKGGTADMTLEKKNITRVRSHTKTYKKGYKPTLMSDGNWATMNVNTKPKKKAWLQEAWRIVRGRQDPVTRKLLQKSLYIAP